MELDKLEKLLELLQKFGVSDFKMGEVAIHLRSHVAVVPEFPQQSLQRGVPFEDIPENIRKNLPSEYLDPSLWSVG